MPEDYYPQMGGGPPPGRPPPRGGPPEKPDKESEYEGETALVPKSFLAGKELRPGDRVEMEVVHIYDDEIEVKPTSETEPKREPGMMSADEEIDDMGMGEKGD